MSCEDCYSYFVKKKKERHTPCSACSKPFLLEENQLVWEIFTHLLPQARFAGMGGVAAMDMNVLPILFDLFQVSEDERYVMFLKLSECYAVALRLWREEQDKAKANTAAKP